MTGDRQYPVDHALGQTRATWGSGAVIGRCLSRCLARVAWRTSCFNRSASSGRRRVISMA